MSDLFDVDIKARPLEVSLKDYHLAPSGEGQISEAWKNKPHRIVYDLIAAVKYYAAIASMQGEAVAMHLACPSCHVEHVDEGEWAKRKHKTHQCQKCGHEWRPFEFATVGVPSSASAEIARLTKELEEARKDAERYRMMRSLDVTPYEKWNKSQKALHRAMNSADTVEMVDAAVDAAISKIGGGE